jgi:hypothetical protein
MGPAPSPVETPDGDAIAVARVDDAAALHGQRRRRRAAWRGVCPQPGGSAGRGRVHEGSWPAAQPGMALHGAWAAARARLACPVPREPWASASHRPARPTKLEADLGAKVVGLQRPRAAGRRAAREREQREAGERGTRRGAPPRRHAALAAACDRRAGAAAPVRLRHAARALPPPRARASHDPPRVAVRARRRAAAGWALAKALRAPDCVPCYATRLRLGTRPPARRRDRGSNASKAAADAFKRLLGLSRRGKAAASPVQSDSGAASRARGPQWRAARGGPTRPGSGPHAGGVRGAPRAGTGPLRGAPWHGSGRRRRLTPAPLQGGPGRRPIDASAPRAAAEPRARSWGHSPASAPGSAMTRPPQHRGPDPPPGPRSLGGGPFPPSPTTRAKPTQARRPAAHARAHAPRAHARCCWRRRPSRLRPPRAGRRVPQGACMRPRARARAAAVRLAGGAAPSRRGAGGACVRAWGRGAATHEVGAAARGGRLAASARARAAPPPGWVGAAAGRAAAARSRATARARRRAVPHLPRPSARRSTHRAHS